MIGPDIPGATLEAFAEGFACGQAGTTLTVTIDDGDGNNVVGPTTASVVEIECSDDGFAVYRYLGVFPSDESLSPYVITWTGLSATDPEVETTATEEIEVSADAPALTDEQGPCSPWIEWDEVGLCCDIDVGSDNQTELEVAAENATLVLFLLSGGLFTGLCGPVTERPATRECGCWQRWRYRDGTVGIVPFWDAGGWRFGDGWGSAFSCSCASLSEVRLANYPVKGIAQVKIDGDVVAPSDYRLDHARLLVRKNSGRWPSCQDLSVDDDQPGTFSVSYWYGRNPPQLAKDAAAALACQLYLACNPDAGDCKLPAGTATIVRQGITIQKATAITALLREGATGIHAIDGFAQAYATKKDAQRPSVWSPDLPWGRRIG